MKDKTAEEANRAMKTLLEEAKPKPDQTHDLIHDAGLEFSQVVQDPQEIARPLPIVVAIPSHTLDAFPHLDDSCYVVLLRKVYNHGPELLQELLVPGEVETGQSLSSTLLHRHGDYEMLKQDLGQLVKARARCGLKCARAQREAQKKIQEVFRVCLGPNIGNAYLQHVTQHGTGISRQPLRKLDSKLHQGQKAEHYLQKMLKLFATLLQTS